MTRLSAPARATSGGTTTTGLSIDSISSKAVLPTGRARRRSARADHDRRDIAGAGRFAKPHDRGARKHPQLEARGSCFVACDSRAIGLDMYWVDSGTEEIGKALRRGEHGPRRKAVVHGCDYARHEIVTSQMSSFLVRTTSSPVKDTAPCSILSASRWPPNCRQTSSASHAGGRRGSGRGVATRPNTGEAEDERLPDAAHRREV